MYRKSSLTVETVLRYLDYSPKTGEFRWKSAPKHRPGLEGEVAGCLTTGGYVSIRVSGQTAQAHRLAWLVTHGVWPAGDIDHVDGNRANNRITNLREASRSENMQNVRKLDSNTSGFVGVSWSARNRKWRAQIKHDNKVRHIGLFTDPRLAHEAYLAEKARLHTFNPTVREQAC